MICIEAVIRPERIGAVTTALVDVGVPGFYYYNVTGQGRSLGEGKSSAPGQMNIDELRQTWQLLQL